MLISGVTQRKLEAPVAIPKTLVVIAKFLIHVVTAGVAFVIIFLVVIGLSMFAEWVDSLAILHPILVNVLYSLEYVLFGIDILGFIFVLIVEFWRLLQEMYALRKI